MMYPLWASVEAATHYGGTWHHAELIVAALLICTVFVGWLLGSGSR